VARLPSAESLLSRRGPEEVCAAFFAVVFKLVLGGTVTPEGRGTRSRGPSAAGRRRGPEAVTEQEAEYITADSLQNRYFFGPLAVEDRRNSSSIPAGMSDVRRTWSPTPIACLQRTIRLHYLARDQVDETSRVSSMNGHEYAPR